MKKLSLILFALSITLLNAQNPETLELKKLNLKPIESVIDEQLGKVDKETGALRVKRNEYFKSEAQEASEIALSYLQAKRDLYKLSNNPDDIKTIQTTETPFGKYVYFEQYVNDIPVFATNFIVHINKENVVTYALNRFRNTATYKEIITIPSVNEYDALEFAKEYLDIKGEEIRTPKTKLVYFESKDKGLELAWKTNITLMKHAGSWQIFVSASDGRIIHAENTALFANGSGKVFKVNPLVSANVPYGYNNCYLHGNGATNPCLESQLVQVTLNDLEIENGLYKLKGPYCIVEADPGHTIPESRDGIFNYQRGTQDFSAVMSYYHVDLAARRILELGYEIPDSLKKLRIYPLGNWGGRRSAYLDSENYIYLGGGGDYVPAGEDADIIWHEYAHAMQYNFNPNFTGGDETSAILEGSSDYWATSYKRSLYPDNWSVFALWFDMDDMSITSPRILDSTWVYPNDCHTSYPGANYFCGQIWSSALMKIWGDIGRDTTDILFLETLCRWDAPSMRGAATEFIYADIELFEGRHLCPIVKHFDAHGLTDFTARGVINQNTVWNNFVWVTGNITIPSGVTLTITSEVKCESDVSITVHPGGKLIINGGTLTNACPGEMWQGITVWGDLTKPLTQQYQGYLELKNNGTIENAITGIAVYNGGIVKASNAYFTNNTTGVFCDKAGECSFSETIFDLNDNYFDNKKDFVAHIKVQSSSTVNVHGCTFSSTAPANGQNYNSGIWASNTNLNVREFCPLTGGVEACSNICEENDRTENKFSGFTYGIQFFDFGSSPILKVRCTNFEKSIYRHIYLALANYPQIIRNKFDLTQSDARGILIRNSTGYKIEENSFINLMPVSDKKPIGLTIQESGILENEVYKNTFTGLDIAQLFALQNSSQVDTATGPGGPHRGIGPDIISDLAVPGVQSLCNVFNNSQSKDIFVQLGKNSAIRKNQGNALKPAGNQFNDNLFAGTPLLNIDNALSQFAINYYCRTTNNEYPNNVTQTNRIITTNINNCPSKICILEGGGLNDKGEGLIARALAQYDKWNLEYQYWLEKLLAMGGEQGEEYDKILDLVSYYSALKDNYFNSIIVAAMGEEGEKEKGEGEKFLLLYEEKVADGDSSPDDGRGDTGWGSLYETLRFLFSYRGHYIDHLSITETYLAENNFTEALATLSKIYKLFEITEEQAAELQGFEFYINWLQQLEANKKSIYELSEKELDYLVNFVKTHTGRGAVFANNILCELYNVCIEEDTGSKQYAVGGDDEVMRRLDDEMMNPRKSVSSASSACQNALENITLHPNPTTGELRIENGELRIKSVEVFDVYGRKLQSKIVNLKSEIVIDISHLNSGIYFVKITTEQGEIVRKVVKQ